MIYIQATRMTRTDICDYIRGWEQCSLGMEIDEWVPSDVVDSNWYDLGYLRRVNGVSYQLEINTSESVIVGLDGIRYCCPRGEQWFDTVAEALEWLRRGEVVL